MHEEIIIPSEDAVELRAELGKREDAESARELRFLDMPDLTRTDGSPIHELAKRILELPNFQDFDVLKVPEIVSAKESFDPFEFPPDHPARSRSDTYYVNEDRILRTHTTVMWRYHLDLPEVKARIAKGEAVGALSYGKVYRKDEIDRRHMNVFHQMDGWYLCRLEMEVDMNGNWVEVLGSGVVKGKVLDNFGVDSKIWNGWAFGFGLERLAILSMELPDIRLLWSEDERVKKQLVLGNKFREVSKFPPIVRDISFIVNKDFVPNDYFDLIRDLGGELVEEVSLLDKYENAERFGADKLSYTYRIVYRSNERTLTTEEIEPIQKRVEEETKGQFGGEVR